MKWYNSQYYWQFFNIRVNSKNQLQSLPEYHLKPFKWAHKHFYIWPLNVKLTLKLKKHAKIKRFLYQNAEYLLTKQLINNFCTNGKYLKYHNNLLNVFNQLYWLFYSHNFHAMLSSKQSTNLGFFLTNLRSNLLLNLTSHLLFFIFAQYEILFFSKVIKLKRNIAKRVKRKFNLEYYYITHSKRLLKTIKFWKFYSNSILKYTLSNRLLFALLNLILEHNQSFLAQYKTQIIKTLIKKKKLEF